MLSEDPTFFTWMQNFNSCILYIFCRGHNGVRSAIASLHSDVSSCVFLLFFIVIVDIGRRKEDESSAIKKNFFFLPS